MKNSKAVVLGLILGAVPVLQAADQAMDPTQPGVKNAPAKPIKMSKKKAMYKCPMDGTMSSKPGKCPKCGMDMEKVPASTGMKKS